MAENETAAGAAPETAGESSGEATGEAAATPQPEAASAQAEPAPEQAEPAPEQAQVPPEEITYHAVEKDGQVTALWEMQGRKHLRTIDPRSRQGQEILRLYTAEHGE
jgi:hypothetical protein